LIRETLLHVNLPISKQNLFQGLGRFQRYSWDYPLTYSVGIYSETFPTVLQDLKHAKNLQKTEVIPKEQDCTTMED